MSKKSEYKQKKDLARRLGEVADQLKTRAVRVSGGTEIDGSVSELKPKASSIASGILYALGEICEVAAVAIESHAEEN